MIQYTFSWDQPNSHYINIEIFINDCKGESINLQLPSWRPGRYELGNFAKNIKKFQAFDIHGNQLSFQKNSKDSWSVQTGGTSMLKVIYSYYASEINAGSSYLDEHQLYVNPVNCCMYIPLRMNEEHVVLLNVPDHYKVATSLKKTETFAFSADNFDELADSPFIASDQIKTISFFAKDLPVHLHFVGECNPDEERIINDFKQFSEHCIDFFGEAPINEYHFLFQILPYKFYHGVEHLKSTVIAIGPGHQLMKGTTYEDVLGVSCHEFFHLWNIKTIRPEEMMPYDYTKENYARTGYVYEGFTTYYGDLLLYESGVFTQEQYFKTLEERLNKHFHNYGRFNLSLADSSFDTWLDGYVPGAPYRKVSIYDEGNLFALILDVNISVNTNGRKSLKDVCKILYTEFGKKQKGYSEKDIIRIVNEVSSSDLSHLFQKYCYGTESYEAELIRCFNKLGWEIFIDHSQNINESVFGFKVIDGALGKKITLIAPDSPAFNCGLMMGDEIIAVNSKFCKVDLKEWLGYYVDKYEPISLKVLRGNVINEVSINYGDKNYFQVRIIKNAQ
ncbi:MAG: M61 family metallopeptidase [Bacteroidota bacterium]